MTVELRPIMIPCRKCNARPGEDCMRTALVGPSGLHDGFHRQRLNDTKRVSALIDW